MVRQLALAGLMMAVPSLASSQTGIERLSWMQGCWQLTSGDRVVEEQWMAPRGGIMLGSGRTVRAGKLVEHEFVLLAERDGRLAYEAHPSGQPSATFLSKQLDATSVVFEDPAHDFPQRVGYRKESTDRMLAWIEGTMAGQARRVEFPMQRMDCPR
jgi:hypothetical protein